MSSTLVCAHLPPRVMVVAARVWPGSRGRLGGPARSTRSRRWCGRTPPACDTTPKLAGACGVRAHVRSMTACCRCCQRLCCQHGTKPRHACCMPPQLECTAASHAGCTRAQRLWWPQQPSAAGAAASSCSSTQGPPCAQRTPLLPRAPARAGPQQQCGVQGEMPQGLDTPVQQAAGAMALRPCCSPAPQDALPLALHSPWACHLQPPPPPPSCEYHAIATTRSPYTCTGARAAAGAACVQLCAYVRALQARVRARCASTAHGARRPAALLHGPRSPRCSAHTAPPQRPRRHPAPPPAPSAPACSRSCLRILPP